jgi:hypothetical protein
LIAEPRWFLHDLVTILLRGEQTGRRVGMLLVQSTPAGFEAFVEAMSRPAGAEGLPEPAGPPTPEQAAQLTRVAAEHGIEILGPPGARP